MSRSYPFDPTGELPSNYIDNEVKTPVQGNTTDAYVLIPNATPFYKKGFSMVNEQGITLKEGIDFYFIYEWATAKENVGQTVCGGIALLSTANIGPVRLNYHTLGGTYVDNRANLVQEGLVALDTVSNLDWSTAPTAFPPTPFNTPLNGIDGVPSIIQALDRIQVALTQPIPAIHLDDVTDLDTEFITPLLAKMNDLVVAINISRGVNDITQVNASGIADIYNRLDAIDLKLLHASTQRNGIMTKEDYIKLQNL